MPTLSPVRPADAAAYQRHHAAFMDALQAKTGDFSWYAEQFSPYPLLFDAAEVDNLAQLRAAIHRALLRVVNAYGDDPRLAAVISLPPRHRELLARARRLPYRVGSFRPDLLLDRAGVWRVCEINARFPLNGYVSSHYINGFVGGLGYLADSGAQAVAALDGLLEAIAGRFAPGQPLVILREREKGMDTHLLARELPRYGIPLRVRPPSALTVRGGTVYDGEQAVGQFILELERDELLGLNPELFDALAACPAYFNDLRTLMLVHDKRMLAVLGDSDIMADYLDEADRALLARHVLPTYPANDPRIAADLRTRPSDWVLKRNSSGRGIGMLIGGECDASAWRQTLVEHADDYTAQRFLPQQTLALPVLENGQLMERAMNVVAMLPGFDGELFGPGFFRAGLDGIINVHGGRGEIVPAMLAA